MASKSTKYYKKNKKSYARKKSMTLNIPPLKKEKSIVLSLLI